MYLQVTFFVGVAGIFGTLFVTPVIPFPVTRSCHQNIQIKCMKTLVMIKAKWKSEHIWLPGTLHVCSTAHCSSKWPIRRVKTTVMVKVDSCKLTLHRINTPDLTISLHLTNLNVVHERIFLIPSLNRITKTNNKDYVSKNCVYFNRKSVKSSFILIIQE